MKKGVHPQLYTDAVIVCACGNSFTTISTKKTINVEICSSCHPFFTGQQKFIDTEGRIEKFAKKVKNSADKKTVADERKAAKKAKKGDYTKGKTESQKISLKDLLNQSKQSST